MGLITVKLEKERQEDGEREMGGRERACGDKGKMREMRQIHSREEIGGYREKWDRARRKNGGKGKKGRAGVKGR
jgi:hypothetical protein